MNQLNPLVTRSKINQALNIFRHYAKPLNFLDLIRLNENAHTRVLASLLKPRNKNEPATLKTFVKMVSEKMAAEVSDGQWNSAEVMDQSDNIDCLVKVGKWAVVIENKINGAVDRPNQLNKYTQNAKQLDGIDEVILVYLTMTGGKPSTISLSVDEVQRLGDQFVCISYQNQILPWLMDEILPNCRISETSLVASLEIYIDHLNGILGQREGEQAMVGRLFALFDLKPDLSSYEQLKKYSESLEEINSEAEDFSEQSDFRAAIQVMLREIERKIPYINEEHVASVLVGMFRNEPPWLERSTWQDNCTNVAPLIPGKFLYYGRKLLTLRGKTVEIHMGCSPEGIRHGPYLVGSGERQFGKEALEAIGMKKEKGDLQYHLPFESFDPERTSLLEVALHLKSLVDKLRPAGLD